MSPYVWGLSKELLKKNNAITILGVGKGSIKQTNFEVLTTSPPEVFRSLQKTMGSLPIAPSKVLFDKFLIKEVLRVNIESKIDVLHLNIPYSIADLAPLLGIPSVCSLHNEIKTVFPLKYCDQLLPVSKFLQLGLLKKGVCPRKVTVLPIAIDTTIFKPLKSQVQAKKSLNLEKTAIILFVGRKCPEKGPQVLIKALSKVVKHYPNAIAVFIGPDYHFGSNTSNYTNQLIATASKLNLKNKTMFLNYISQEKLLQFFNAADIVVCPSVWQEPLGKVVIEALAFEKPVVASNVGGIPEIITNGVNGLLVPPDKPDDLANAIISLLDNKEASSEMGKRGRVTVEKTYSFEAVAKQSLEIYKSLSK